jgi:phenylalanyl-tRNA synthetase alpha subunit
MKTTPLENLIKSKERRLLTSENEKFKYVLRNEIEILKEVLKNISEEKEKHKRELSEQAKILTEYKREATVYCSVLLIHNLDFEEMYYRNFSEKEILEVLDDLKKRNVVKKPLAWDKEEYYVQNK